MVVNGVVVNGVVGIRVVGISGNGGIFVGGGISQRQGPGMLAALTQTLLGNNKSICLNIFPVKTNKMKINKKYVTS